MTGETSHKIATSGTGADVAVEVDPSGFERQVVILGGASTATPSTANMTTTTGSVLASNPLRVGASIFNALTSPDSVYLAFAGTSATASGYLVVIVPGGYFEVPYRYTGAISGICATSTATLIVNEIAP